ncbi:MAG: AarF/UbiB family protein [Arachnia sp.]
MDIIGFVLNFLVLTWLARRLLGIPVGWGRVAIMTATIVPATSMATNEVLEFFGVTADSPALPVGLLLMVLLGCVLALELILLTILEALIPTHSVPTLTSVITGFPAAVRRQRRYLTIWWILLRRGLTAYLSPAPATDLEQARVARSLRLALSDAGVTFVKFGQMLATRADLLPAAFVRELSRLHSDVAPEPWSAIRPVLEESLGRPFDDVFTRLDEEPMAAASVAQIHSARLTDGREVVVKVQRPKARGQVTADLDILRRLAVRLERHTAWGRQIGAVALADGFARSLDEELDYTVEVSNMRAVAAASDLLVPTPIAGLCTDRVIVMSRVDGTPLSSASAQLALLGDDERAALADRLLTGVLRQVFVGGVFHADLHPGNVIYLPHDGVPARHEDPSSAPRAGGLALLDFGSVGRLDRPTRNALILLLYAVQRQDAIAATDALLDLMDRPDDLDDRALEREVGGLLLRYGDGIAGGSASMFADLFDVVVRYGFRVPPQLAAVFRTLGTLDGTLRLLDPHVDMVAIAKARGTELAQGLLGRDAVKAQVEHQLATLLPILARLPRRLSRITEQLEDGTLSVNVRAIGNSSDRHYVSSIGNQLNLTILGSALGFGGLMLLVTDGGPMLMPGLATWPLLGVTLLFLAFTIGARVLATIFFREERRD